MATITAFTATPDTVPAGGTSILNLQIVGDPGTPDTVLHVNGTVEETGQATRLAVTFQGKPAEKVAIVLPGESSQQGITNIRLTAPDGGVLARTDNQITFRQT